MSDLKSSTPAVERDRGGPETVWAVLADGWLYPTWVVGASRMREVDRDWPEVGSRLHHSVGNWPLLLDDQTEVLECRPWRLLRLKAHAWPAGAAEVLIELDPQADSSTLVRIREDASDGPATLVPGRPGSSRSVRATARRSSAWHSSPKDAPPAASRCGSTRPHADRRRRRRTAPSEPSAARAAFQPQAPCTPPPGCAEAPAR